MIAHFLEMFIGLIILVLFHSANSALGRVLQVRNWQTDYCEDQCPIAARHRHQYDVSDFVVALRESSEGPFVVSVSFQNPLNVSLSLLRWDTPFEGLYSPKAIHVLDVTNVSQLVPYRGPILVRMMPENESSQFLKLLPCETFEVKMDLSAAFEFRETQVYELWISFSATLEIFESHGVVMKQSRFASNVLQLRPQANSVTPRFQPSAHALRSVKTVPARSGKYGEFYLNGCSSFNLVLFRDDILKGAVESASLLLEKAIEKLCIDSDVFIQWFGTSSDQSYQRAVVKIRLEKIRQRILEGGFTIHCASEPGFTACERGAGAYVYKYRHHHIYICNLFWYAFAVGKITFADAIIHEFSHFSDLGDTWDCTQGYDNSLALAASSPCQALLNAQSYSSFAIAASSAPIPIVPCIDDLAPRILRFSISPTVVGLGDSVEILVESEDIGGSHLWKVEIWRAEVTPTCDLPSVQSQCTWTKVSTIVNFRY